MKHEFMVTITKRNRFGEPFNIEHFKVKFIRFNEPVADDLAAERHHLNILTRLGAVW